MNLLSFNLTTPEGRQQALDAYDKYGWIVFPQYWLLRKAWKFLSEKSISTLKAQRKVAEDLIKAGRDNDVDEMTIVLDQTVGVDIGSEVEGIPIKLKIGDSGHAEIKVKYKKTN